MVLAAKGDRVIYRGQVSEANRSWKIASIYRDRGLSAEILKVLINESRIGARVGAVGRPAPRSFVELSWS